MPGVSKAQIDRARQIDLLSYLETHEPDELKRDGPGRYITASHDSLVISNGMWMWNSRGIGGRSALDYLIKVRGVGFVEAVETLAGGRVAELAPIKPRASPSLEKRHFSPPRPSRFASNVVAYLQRRGIHPDIIRQCLRAGTLYEARWSEKVVCVFTGMDTEGKMRFACMRGINGDFKMDAVGSDKRYSFCVSATNPDSHHLAVFESPIDALSHATLQQRKGWNWDGYRLSLGGTSPVALTAFLKRNPQIRRVVLHLDTDRPGLLAARRIKAMLSADKRFEHLRISVNPPRMGADYNASLLHAIRREQAQKPHTRHGPGVSL
ncbi:MAG: DUF3991 and toprim domain-containing protein [Oscillospiraceae bacterium]|nr:DUF3991 and toprim domain-containing protein [Oscillospiraceae bacterium]